MTTLIAPQTDVDQSDFERILAAVKDLQPLLRSYAAQVEEDRRVPDEVIEALEEIGVFRIRQPVALGGYGLSVHEQVEILGELGRACPSTGYMTAMLVGNSAIGLFYPPEVQGELYSDPNMRVSVLFASSPTTRRTEGGWIISGKWGYATGSPHATWAAVAFERMDDNGVSSGTSFGLIKLSDAKIVDTWQVVGLVGTGSFSVVAENLFVPDAYCFDLSSFRAVDDMFGLACSLGVMMSTVGIAQGMLDATLETLGKEKPIAYTTYRRAIDAPSYQLNIADAAQLIDEARFHLFRATDDYDAAAAGERVLSQLDRARVRADVGSAARRMREATELLLNVGGPSAFAISSPLQRHWRDIALGSRHGYINSDIAREAYGKALLGLDVREVTLDV